MSDSNFVCHLKCQVTDIPWDIYHTFVLEDTGDLQRFFLRLRYVYVCLYTMFESLVFICKVNKGTYCRSICCTQMLWDSSAYLLYLFDWNIILEQEPKYICEHDDSTFLSQAFKLFEPFLRCLDHFEQPTSSSSSFVGEVWFQQDHSGNVHQRPRQGADAFNAAVNVASFSAVAQAAVLGLLLGTPVLAVVLWLLGSVSPVLRSSCLSCPNLCDPRIFPPLLTLSPDLVLQAEDFYTIAGHGCHMMLPCSIELLLSRSG